ncbi:MAG: asparagine synthetase B [bacterium]|nr:asparagine synthetase B [bacterium]
MKIVLLLIVLFFFTGNAAAQYILIPMDRTQNDHLKAYGIAFWSLENTQKVDWLLNYKGGAFLIKYIPALESELRVRGVSFQVLRDSDVLTIRNTINNSNMEIVKLEKAPSIAVYSPPNKQPWDDAVTLALTYAEIPYKVLWDEEVLRGELEEYDWLHLHHEDFTGQYGKFYANYGGMKWYLEDKQLCEDMAKKLGFAKVSEEKKAVARWIKDYVSKGGFLFAMCSATDTYDIALASENIDIAATPFDGDPVDPDWENKLDYSKTFAFTDFKLVTDPAVYEFSNIDYPSSINTRWERNPNNDYFKLFEFAAKYDPVQTMLTQNHVKVVKGFMGQTTGFHRALLKKSVTILGNAEGTRQVKYIHGNHGKGSFTFLAGHDPEDYSHVLGDPPTQLSLHKNSPGYRLILNNILFPAAKKKTRKTE